MTELATKAPPIAEVLARRAEVLAAGGRYMPSEQESQALALHVMAQVDLGHRTVADLADDMKISERATWKWLARGRALKASPGDVATWRWMILTLLEELHQIALEDRDVKEARNALIDMGRVLGIVSTGGNAPTVNVGVQVGAVGEEEFRSEMREWMAANRPQVIEAEVVET